jgi:hypothetical protein
MRNKDVIEGFLRGEVCNTLHLFSTGDRLLSYNTCIAEIVGETLYINKTRYSVTTSIHLGLLLRRLDSRKIKIVTNIGINTRYLRP